MRTRLWIFLHALVAVLPAVGTFTLVPDVSLFGAEVPPVWPKVTFEGWRTEKVQPALQSWFEAHIALRGVMVRTDNTTQAVVLHEKPNNAVIIGTDGILFHGDDVAYMGARREELPNVYGRIDALTRGLGSVHRKLKAKGKQLVVVIAPSKTAVYPEAVPAGWRRDGYRADVVVHDVLRSSLEREGVRFADGHALLAGKAGEERARLFTVTGRHWTPFGACIVLREGLPPEAVKPSCAYDMAVVDPQVSDDYDLYRLQNLWRIERNMPLLPVLKEQASAPTGPSSLPRTVFAGTSFTWMLADVMRPFVSKPVAIFYNTNVYDVSEPTRRLLAPADPDTAEWEGYVLDRDLYVLEILETYAHGEHMIKFVETLDRRLGAAPQGHD